MSDQVDLFTHNHETRNVSDICPNSEYLSAIENTASQDVCLKGIESPPVKQKLSQREAEEVHCASPKKCLQWRHDVGHPVKPSEVPTTLSIHDVETPKVFKYVSLISQMGKISSTLKATSASTLISTRRKFYSTNHIKNILSFTIFYCKAGT